MYNESQLQERLGLWREQMIASLRAHNTVKVYGRVKQVLGTLVEAQLPEAKIGDLCIVGGDSHSASHSTSQGSVQTSETMLAEVVGFTEDTVLLSSLRPLDGVAYGTPIESLGCKHRIVLPGNAFGEVFDGIGRNMEGQGPSLLAMGQHDIGAMDVVKDAALATDKPRITDPLPTGVKAIDTLLTIGEGQRIGLFAGAGCGKTTLLASIARGTSADVVVFALVGERGRELKELLDHEIDASIRERSIIVCATSDRSSMERSRAAFTATAIAESLRDQGKKVLLLVDSLTRFARAQREIGLAAGEPPAKGGFPPSVYTMLPRLIERAGKTSKGSITAIYTVLIEGDSMQDPIADEAKSLLDGHIVLSRKLAEKGHYPAIDVLMSLSRTMNNVVDREHQRKATEVRELMAKYNDLELLIRLGEYQPGMDAASDRAIACEPRINAFLKQATDEVFDMDSSLSIVDDALA